MTRETKVMRDRCLAVFLCLVAAAGLLACAGCGMFTPERNQRRADIARRDVARIPDQVDWILGFDEENTAYHPALPPYKYW